MPRQSGSSAPVVSVARRLARETGELRWRTPSHVYDPLRYAWPAHREYLERFGTKRGRVILLGMNPGPWGMAQTGVPFGDPVMVREWFRIASRFVPPLPEQHPKYPLRGLDCHRREGSGARLWGWARERLGTPDRFFARFFVWNYCPLLFLGQGHNLTPERLRRDEADALIEVCDRALAKVVTALAPAAVVGIGRYAETRARAVLGERLPIVYLTHPSPASPVANRDWPTLAERALAPWLPARVRAGSRSSS